MKVAGVDGRLAPQLWEAPAQHDLRQLHPRCCRLDFSEPQPLQAQHRRPSRQAVAHVLHQGKGLRSRQHQLPAGLSVGVDHSFEMAKQARRVLHLIDQQWQRVPSQKAGRVVFGRCGFAGQVERHVVVLRKQVSAQGRFARLAGAREHQHPTSRRPLTSSKSTGPPLGWRGSSWPLISFDRDFRSFQPQGLDLWLLPPAA